MRVLFLNENIGGHATVHVNLRRAFGDIAGVETRFIDVPPRAGLRRFAGTAVPGLGRLDLDLQQLRDQLGTSAAARRLLARDLREWRPDVLHVYTQNAGLLSTGLMRRVPTVVTTDSTNALNAFRIPGRLPTRFTSAASRPSQRIERRVFDAARVIVANNDYAADSIRDSYGIEAAKIRTIPFGVSIPDGPARLPLAGRPRITFVGRTLARKGGLQLLDVHQRRFREDCDLVLVTKEAVRPCAAVEVVGDIVPGDPRLWDILRNTSVFAFPSRIDQAPNVVLEAMAAGVPIVASRVGGIPEMVEHGVTGLLVAPDDDGTELEESIAAILGDPARQAAMGAAGRARAVDRYDIRLAAGALRAVFEEVR